MPASALRPALLALAAVNLVTGLAMALAPRAFFDEIAPFGAYNDHYIRDLATWTLAIAAAYALAAERPAGRGPVLAVGVVQGALHVANHVIDIGDTDPSWAGPVNVVVLGVYLAVLVWLLRSASGSRRPVAG